MPFDPPRITVFCGSRHGARPEFSDAARALGRTIAERGLGLVTGGGSVGLMGVVADAALEAGGEVIGVIPQVLSRAEVAHHGLSELLVVDSMHTRKMRMNELCGGFVALPGGIGTFEELFEVLSWRQLRIHAKPIGLYDVAGYWTGLRSLLDQAVAEGFLNPVHRSVLLRADDPELLLDRMAAERIAAADPDAVEP
ncbi:MAG: TIGR00730 family Rossman fold protein [Planctomycetota bacterium]|nr:MAG: TIGR00730 family Rossman fold protein [Planctomycetota bacterium]